MKSNVEIINSYFKQIYGLKVRNIKQGHGSFLTMEFGKDLKYEVKVQGKIEKEKRGEWYFWIYMSAWRIDDHFKPIAGCEDSRSRIINALKKIETQKLINIEILNPAYDMKIEFENSIIINLFSIYTEDENDSENWLLFTPEKKVLSTGPGNKLKYKNSGE